MLRRRMQSGIRSFVVVAELTHISIIILDETLRLYVIFLTARNTVDKKRLLQLSHVDTKNLIHITVRSTLPAKTQP